MTTLPKHIERVISAATRAPSGDNSQPWRFVFCAPNTLEIHAITNKDNALFNVDGSGTLIAFGAAIQNAELEAKSAGFTAEVRYSDNDIPTATLVFQKGGELSEIEHNLHRAIPLRHSNRKAYKKIQLISDDKLNMIDVTKNIKGASLTFIEDIESMSLISRALTTMEEIALKNKLLHKLFFGSIFWSKKRNEEGSPGLYIKTLELPPPAQLLFKALRHWSVTNLLAKIGFPRMVAKMNAKQNANASAFGVITIDEFDHKHYIEAGRLLERVWLVATARGMSFQIVTGILFLARALERNVSAPFSIAERAKVREAYSRIRENLKELHEPLLIFRVGYGAASTAVSCRRAPDVTYMEARTA